MFRWKIAAANRDGVNHDGLRDAALLLFEQDGKLSGYSILEAPVTEGSGPATEASARTLFTLLPLSGSIKRSASGEAALAFEIRGKGEVSTTKTTAHLTADGLTMSGESSAESARPANAGRTLGHNSIPSVLRYRWSAARIAR